MNTQSEVKEQITNGYLKSDFLESIAKQLGSHVGAKIVYGEPIGHDGVTVIPVAKALYCFGGGAGHQKNGEEGLGGGGAAKAQPVGYIELKNGGAAFRPIHSTRDSLTMILLGVISGAMLSWAVNRVVGQNPLLKVENKKEKGGF